jgi:hypothetical protein
MRWFSRRRDQLIIETSPEQLEIARSFGILAQRWESRLISGVHECSYLEAVSLQQFKKEDVQITSRIAFICISVDNFK